jgi:hypothetical protein
MANIFKNIAGALGNVFKIGLGANQVQLKNDSGTLQIRNSADDGYAILRAGTPLAANDVVTKNYADTLERTIKVARQADCTSELPANTAVAGYVVVSTEGTGTSIGDLLYDDGSETGTMSIVAAVEGRIIATTVALTGGSEVFDADSLYLWDLQGDAWVKIGDIGSVTGAVRTIRMALDNSASQESDATIPANNRVLSCRVEVTTAYSAGATISVGYTGAVDAFMTTAQNNPQTEAEYVVEQDTASDSTARGVLITISNAPAAGVGVLVVEYCNPNA